MTEGKAEGHEPTAAEGGRARGPHFRKRTLYFLKVGTRTVLPTKVHLHERKSFTAEDLGELIAMVEKHVVSKYVRRVRGRQGDIVFAEMKNTTKKEKQEFSARCTPFKRSSCVSERLRFGYYFHEEPFGQPVVLTPLREEEESESVLINLVEQEAIERMIMEELGAKKKNQTGGKAVSTTKVGQGGDIANLVISSSASENTGKATLGKRERLNESPTSARKQIGVATKKASMKQLSLVDLVVKRSDDSEEACDADPNIDSKLGQRREREAEESESEERDDMLSSQEELELLLEVGREERNASPPQHCSPPRPQVIGVEDESDAECNEKATKRENTSVLQVSKASSPMSAVNVPEREKGSRGPCAATISLLEDDEDEDYLSASPLVKELEDHERALSIDFSGKGQRRWKEMKTLPYTLMIFTRPQAAPSTIAKGSKAPRHVPTPPPISISSYFGMKNMPTKRKRSASPRKKRRVS